MGDIKGIRELNISLTANVEKTVAVTGEIVMLRSASTAVEVRLDHGSVSSLGAGGVIRADAGQTYDKIHLRSASSIDIVILAGFGDIEDAPSFSTSATSMTNGTVTVGTSATLLSAANAGRAEFHIQPKTDSIYVGNSGVTTANGVEVKKDQTYIVNVTSAIYAISPTAANDTRIMEFA